MKLSVLVSAAVASEKTWQTKEWQVQDAYFAEEEIILQDPKVRSNKQWHDCGDKPPMPQNGRDVRCYGAICAAVCPIGWRSQGRWKIKCQADNTWSHSRFSPCITCPDMSDELDKIVEAEIGAVSQSIFRRNLPVAQFFCGKSTDTLRIKNQVYKNGGKKRDVKCLCKNGQNGDPAWKKSCSWVFKGAPWYPSDVKSVTCKVGPIPPPPPPPSCEEKYPAPPGYTVQETNFGKVYYKVQEGYHNIAVAREMCSSDASYLTLPIPRNEEQNDFYYNLVGRQEGDLWLGISDTAKEGEWVGQDGKLVTWFKWRPGEPNNKYYGETQPRPGEHWLEMDLTEKKHLKEWNDTWFSSKATERLDTYNNNIAICTFIVPKKC